MPVTSCYCFVFVCFLSINSVLWQVHIGFIFHFLFCRLFAGCFMGFEG
jgi:hypothetical protein